MSILTHIKDQESIEKIDHNLSVAIDLFSVAGYILKFSKEHGFSVIMDDDTLDWKIKFSDKEEVILQYTTFPHSLIDISYKVLDDGAYIFDLQLSGIANYNQDILDVVNDYTFSCVKSKLIIED